jgi:hypothetical protein
VKQPCAQCPFKLGSSYRYDADAMEALNDDNTPACHLQVGLDSIFAHAPLNPPTGSECAGYTAWLDGRSGFAAAALSPPSSGEQGKGQ